MLYEQAWRRFWPYLGSSILLSLAVGGLCITIIGIPLIILWFLDVGSLFIMIVGIPCAIVSIPFRYLFFCFGGVSIPLPVLFEGDHGEECFAPQYRIG